MKAQSNSSYSQEANKELEAWSVLTGRPLPMPAAQIAFMESCGFVVDLVTGEFWMPEDRAPAAVQWNSREPWRKTRYVVLDGGDK